MDSKEHYNEVWLSFGSNCGDRKKMIQEALEWTMRRLSWSKVSEVYETPELHGRGAPYLNAVMRGFSSMKMEVLNEEFKKYELLSGRDSECRRLGKVPIDIDIVIWNNYIIREKDFSCSFFQIGYLSIKAAL